MPKPRTGCLADTESRVAAISHFRLWHLFKVHFGPLELCGGLKMKNRDCKPLLVLAKLF